MAGVATFLQATSHSADETVATYAGQNLGTASADRRIVVGCYARAAAARTLSSVKIHVPNIATDPTGISATIVLQTSNVASLSAIAIAAVPTGTAGDVVVTYSSTEARNGIGLWNVTGIDASAPYDTGSSVASDPSDTVNIPADGIGIAIGFNASTGTTTPIGLTERFDDAVETSNRGTGSSDAFASIQTGLTVGFDWVTNSVPVMVFASWGPAAAGGGRFVKMAGQWLGFAGSSGGSAG